MIDAKMISDYVDAHSNDAISFLQAILRVPSVTGDEEAVAKVFADKMRDAGLEVQVYEAAPHRPNLLAEWFGSVPGKRFVFNGHMDVFPPNEGDPGLYGPWSGELHDGKNTRNAYEDFGRRCLHPAYKKMMLLFEQNMRKGNEYLLEQLEREERNVYETRLRKIKSAGETASTKLLIPMGGLLGMVLIVLVVPAFFTIQI